jgi:hypothetical protein
VLLLTTRPMPDVKMQPVIIFAAALPDPEFSDVRRLGANIADNTAGSVNTSCRTVLIMSGMTTKNVRY